jgi:predicted metal-dependent hydrolase
MPDDLRLAPGETLPLAQRLIDDGRPFHAHEVLEIAWKSVPSAERQVWKGLAQIAVGLTHARRGNAVGATALLRRGAAAVGGYAGELPAGLDVTVVRIAGELAMRIERSGIDSVTDEDLRPRLTTR